MPKLVKNWKELSEVTSPNYKIIIDKDMCSGWIYPKEETEETKKNWYDHHVYLSTHSFYKEGNTYKNTNKILEKFGFDGRVEHW